MYIKNGKPTLELPLNSRKLNGRYAYPRPKIILKLDLSLIRIIVVVIIIVIIAIKYVIIRHEYAKYIRRNK